MVASTDVALSGGAAGQTLHPVKAGTVYLFNYYNYLPCCT